jgi:hypothetical protein
LYSIFETHPSKLLQQSLGNKWFLWW